MRLQNGGFKLLERLKGIIEKYYDEPIKASVQPVERISRLFGIRTVVEEEQNDDNIDAVFNDDEEDQFINNQFIDDEEDR